MAKAKRIGVRTIDFSNVKESSGINPKHKEDGEYLGRVIEIRDDDAKDGEAMWNFIFAIDADKTATYPYYVKLVDNQLWKLRNLMIAAGLPVPKKAMKVDPNKVVGLDVGLILVGEEYEGKMKSVIDGLIPASELSDYDGAVEDDDEDDEDEDEEPAPKKRGRPAKKAPVEEDDDDEDEDEEPAPKKRGRGRPKKVVEEDDDDEDDEPAPVKRGRGRPKKVVEPEEDDDDDEDEEPAPVKRGRGRPKKAAPAPAKKKRRARDEDDDDLDIDL